MAHLNGKRGRFLLATGIVNLSLGVGYTMGTTKAHIEYFFHLPFVTADYLGLLVVVASIVTICAALLSNRNSKVESFGWQASMLCSAAMSGTWLLISLFSSPPIVVVEMLALAGIGLVTLKAALSTHEKPAWTTLTITLTGIAIGAAWAFLVLPFGVVWTPWISSFAYGGFAAFVWQASDWPNPLPVTIPQEVSD